MRLEEEIKQTKFVSPLQKAHLNTMFTANWIMDIAKEVLKPFGITHQQYNVLRILMGRKQVPCSGDSIKEVMLDKNPDLTRLLDRLIDRRFVSRKICEENRRKMDISITDKGVVLLDSIGPRLGVKHKRMKNITDEEATELSRILDKMRG